ncbi:FMN-binding negative transcriptional regulator [Actinomadura sp. NAK00032]|uniref:FMN-binding negative transcriptional regulator n=1 Tax=Actinomadura sp. NAK00032 TaxID=2742128 RepID=UPI001591D005|nr:FMN-binding negative transcriptional regulator [Actinomadura sp. NAK00032]QKW35629.1 FMN-binding negative transcriptional regulator [Actinomadura sp. NAK00032]
MYVPSVYREPDASWTVELVRRNPLCQLVSGGPEAEPPNVTHVPVILDPRLPAPPDDLVGGVLWGHMNRANPHWAALRSGTPVVATFTGPHGYVSPTVYGTTPAAPTWDFTAVHVRGTLRRAESADETLATVRATVRAFEGEFGTGWSMADSEGYFRRILPGVGAFRIAVTRVDGMFKLSQEQEPHVRERVRRAFARGARPGHRDVADLMGRLAEAPAASAPAAARDEPPEPGPPPTGPPPTGPPRPGTGARTRTYQPRTY